MAGALSRRDIEMIFRAETDGATRNIGDLSKAVRTNRETLNDLTEAANKGDVALDKLAATSRDLKKVQDELGTARALLTSLNSQTGALEKQQERVVKLEAEYAALQASMKGAEAPTKRLQSAFEAKGRAVDQAREKLAQESAAFAETKAQIEAIIGPVRNFEESFRSIAVSSKEAARGLAIAGEAADTFKAKMAAAQSGGSETDRFKAMAAVSPVSAESIKFIEQMENRVELLMLEEKALETQRRGDAAAEGARKQKQRDDVDRLLAGNVALDNQFEQMAADQERLGRVNAFQKIATDAKAAAADVARIQSTFDATATSASRLGDAILNIVNPSQAAADDLGRVAGAIDRAETALQSKQPLRIAQYQVALNELEQAIAGLQRQAAQVDGLRAQEAAVAAAQAKFVTARAEVDRLANEMLQAGAAGDKFAADLKAAEAALANSQRELQQQNTRLDQLSAKAMKAGIDVKNLAAAEETLTTAATRAAAAQQKLQSKTGVGGKGVGFLGLNPNELQNLSFQVNDVFTSLASGIPLTQVLAQQGGQIFQLFPGAFSRMAALIPILIPLVAVLGVGFAAISKSLSEVSRAREAQATLSSLGETSGYTAEQMVKLENSMINFGVSADDASKAVKKAVSEGINPEALEPFLITATNMADVTGKTVPESVDLMTNAFTRGKQEVLALDDQFHFLTDAERDHIRSMDDSTQQSEIRRYAFERFYDKMQEGADDMNGPWKQATDTWRIAWNSLLDAVGMGKNTIIEVINYISEAILGVTRLINIIRELNKRTTSTSKDPLTNLAESFSAPFTIDYGDAIATADRETMRQMEESRRRFKLPLAGRPDPGKGSRGAQREREQSQDKRAKDDKKAAAKAAREAEAARKRAAAQAAQFEKDYQNQQDTLTSSLDRMTAQALRRQAGTIEEEIANARTAVERQYNQLYDQLKEFEAKFPGRKINGLTPAEYRAQLDQNKALLQDAAQLKVYEENMNDLVAERKRRLDQIIEQVRSGELSPEQGMAKALEVTSELNPKLALALKQARDFAAALNAIHPSPELAAFLAKTDSLIQTTGTGQSNTLARQEGAQLRDIADTRVNSVVQERNALIAAQTALVEAGAISQSDAEKTIAAAFASTTPKIIEQVEAYRALIQAQLASGQIDPINAQRILAELDLVIAQTKYTADNIKQINQAAQSAFGQGVVDLVNGFAKGLVDLASGASTVGDFLGSLGDIALNFAASWLKAIADVLVQMLALQAIKAVFGGGFGGGIGGMIFHGGTDRVGDYSHGARRRSSLNSLSPAILDSIPRYHRGSQGVGLQPKEQLAVVEKGEKIMTEEQQRREAAGAAKPGSGGTKLRQVLAFGDEEVAAAMAGPAGEKTFVTHVKRNVPLLKQMLKD